MCGIYGTTIRYDHEIVARKLDLMRFRGPNHQAFSSYKSINGSHITFGHVRLSIIDLDARSNQPFDYNDSISIVFNGEIYNYKELKKRYLADVAFRTMSDTEVICAMYEKFGSDCVRYFNGMFAYVIFDKKKNVLIGARDRLGKKPFYFWHTDEGFEFASQVKVIQYGKELKINKQARKLYCLQGYIPDPFSIFENVKKLRAGQSFVYSIETNKMDIQQYWEIFDNSYSFDAPKSYTEAKDVVKELLFDSVKLRLNADVPVGVFLSGGIDSSLITAIASKLKSDISAYTIGFDNEKYDESPFAAEIAKSLNIPIKINVCSGEEQQQILGDYIEYFDEPFCDPSMIPSSLVAQKAHEDVTVVLGGDGGDELFFGYTKYESIRYRIEQYRWPYWLRKLAYPYYYYKKGALDASFSTQREYKDVFRSEGIFCYSFDGAERFDRMEVAKEIPDRDLMQKHRGILAYSDYDMKFFMNAVNQKVDRATMRSSLELRNPIMDYRIAEYSRLLPLEYLYTRENGLKGMLKDILFEMVPQDLLERPKRGFTPPTADWFRTSLRERMLDAITYKNVSELLPELDAQKYIGLRDAFLDDKPMDARMFWSVYTYINWYKRYIK